MTGCQRASVKSAGALAAALSRSIDFGVTTTSGRWPAESAWARSRWKCCAGVEGCATVMLSSAQSCRNRSIRVEEWSGPWPS